MKLIHVTCMLLAAICTPAIAEQAANESTLPAAIARELPELLDTYRHLHANPELSFHEAKTGRLLAERMRKLGYNVTENVGGHGVVAMLRNGPGPTVMIRTDMDALPITEQTGLPYASTVRHVTEQGKQVGVMHACGHDLHMANWLGVAEVLRETRNQWQGTVMFVAQPAEEKGAGARAMLEAGLFERFPKPDAALALHVDPYLPHGVVGYTPGWAMAAVDSIDITVAGKGGHAAAPQTTIDPVVIAADLVMDLQTIASRTVDPVEGAVVTVGSIHGGTQRNIIPDQVTLQLTVRTFDDATRETVLAAIERKARAASAAAGAPEPTITVHEQESTGAVYNDPKLAELAMNAVRQALGQQRVVTMPAVMVGEDFGEYGRAGVPLLMMRLGSVAPETLAEAKATGVLPPSIHSPHYAPVPGPTLQTGITAMSAAALELLVPAD